MILCWFNCKVWPRIHDRCLPTGPKGYKGILWKIARNIISFNEQRILRLAEMNYSASSPHEFLLITHDCFLNISEYNEVWYFYVIFFIIFNGWICHYVIRFKSKFENIFRFWLITTDLSKRKIFHLVIDWFDFLRWVHSKTICLCVGMHRKWWTLFILSFWVHSGIDEIGWNKEGSVD